MTKEEWDKELDKEDHRLLLKNTLPDHDSLMQYLRCIFPFTGLGEKLFCNGFMLESVELLKHGVFLYESGYFDCAFYSVRQSIENINNMLYVSESEEEFKKWKSKERFPADSKIKAQLKELNKAYCETKTAIPGLFDNYDNLLKKANKYIHKQGFDTFFVNQQYYKTQETERTNLFVDLLKQSIGLLLIMDIIIDPLSLALSDPEIDARIAFDLMTEPIPTGVLKELLDDTVVERLKQMSFYKNFASNFANDEKMNEATYAIIRFQYFNIEALGDIEKQLHLLNDRQKLCFWLLKKHLSISHIFFQDDFLGYTTSIRPTNELREYRPNQFDLYLIGEENTNIEWNGMFISVFKSSENYVVLLHNDVLSESDILAAKTIIDEKQFQ